MNSLIRALTFALSTCLLCSLLIVGCAPQAPAVAPIPVLPTKTHEPPPTAIGIASPTPDPVTRIDETLNYLTENEAFTGAVLVARNGALLLSKGYGLADREKKVPNTPQTHYRIGSITKQFTAMAILILQAQERLNVQDPLCRYIPECPTAWQEITIHHLLTHTSGIPNFTDQPEYHTWKATSATPLQTIAHFKDLPLSFQPGEDWSYSNSGYILLGYIIEQAAGQTYEAFLQQTIFEPLHMKNTGYDHNDGSLAVGYTGSYSQWDRAAYIDMSVPYAAGALYSTVEDLYLWDQALYTEKLLPKELMALLFTPYATMTGSGWSYGYGWMVGETNHRQGARHGGGIEGFVTSILRYPEDKVTVIVLSNRDTTSSEDISDLLAEVLFGN